MTRLRSLLWFFGGTLALLCILVAYTPSIIQVSQLRDTLVGKAWAGQRTLEVLHRGWHVDGVAVRPDHRMVAHTGFLTTARWLG